MVTLYSAEAVIAWAGVMVPFTIGVDTNAKVIASVNSALDWRTPYQAANWAHQNKVETPDAMKWIDRSIAAGHQGASQASVVITPTRTPDQRPLAVQFTTANGLSDDSVTAICTDTAAPWACAWGTTGVTDGTYDLTSTSRNSFYALPEAGYVQRINDSLRWGVTVYGNGGLNTEYRENNGVPGSNLAPAVCHDKPANFLLGCDKLDASERLESSVGTQR